MVWEGLPFIHQDYGGQDPIGSRGEVPLFSSSCSPVGMVDSDAELHLMLIRPRARGNKRARPRGWAQGRTLFL